MRSLYYTPGSRSVAKRKRPRSRREEIRAYIRKAHTPASHTQPSAHSSTCAGLAEAAGDAARLPEIAGLIVELSVGMPVWISGDCAVRNSSGRGSVPGSSASLLSMETGRATGTEAAATER